MRSSSPSATNTTLTGSLPVTALMDINAFSCAISGPFEFVAPRPMRTFLYGGCSTIRASNGGAFQTSGCVIGMVSYCQ